MLFASRRNILSASIVLSTLLGGSLGADEPNLEFWERDEANAREVFAQDDAPRRLQRQVEALNGLARRHALRVRDGLDRWMPGRVADPLERTRHFMNLAALMTLALRPQESMVSHLIHEKLLRENPWSALRVHLTAVILQSADGPVMTDEPRLGMVFPMPEYEVRSAMGRSAQRLLHALLLFHRDESAAT